MIDIELFFSNFGPILGKLLDRQQNYWGHFSTPNPLLWVHLYLVLPFLFDAATLFQFLATPSSSSCSKVFTLFSRCCKLLIRALLANSDVMIFNNFCRDFKNKEKTFLINYCSQAWIQGGGVGGHGPPK